MPTPLLPSKNSFRQRLTKLRRPLLLGAILLGFACAGGDESVFRSFFQPEAANIRPGDKVYIFTPLLYNSDYTGFDDGQMDDSLSTLANTSAWAKYLGNRYSDKLITNALTDSAAGEAFCKRLAGTNAVAADYLRFAFDTQAVEASGDQWNRTPADTAQLTRLAKQARELATTITDPFLKERYAFQAVKLADEAGDFAASRANYTQLVLPLTTKTFISDWARCRQAGALLSLGQKDQAVFEFAQVFAHCPSRRHAAERSLRIYNLRFTEAALDLAKTDAERLGVYAICAIQPKQDALPLLEKMVTLDPKNGLNELVLAREINRNEYYFDQKRYPGYVDTEANRTDSVSFENRRQSVPAYTQKLLAFTEGAASNTALGNPAFYLTAAAYLQYLAGDYTHAKTTLDKAAEQPTANKTLAQQIALQHMLLLSAQPGVPDATTETDFVSYLTQFKQAIRMDSSREESGTTNFRFTNAFTAASQQMASRYLSQAGPSTSGGGWLSGCSAKKAETVASEPNLAKAYVLRVLSMGGVDSFFYGGDVPTLEDTTSAQTAQAVADYVASPAGEFDEKLVKLAAVDADYTNQLLGRRQMAEGNYEAAAVAFAKVKPAVWQGDSFSQYMTVNPFTVNMPGEGKPKTPYGPIQFVQRMADLQTKAKQAEAANKTGDDVAGLHYELGCGAYNLSYWGNAWLMNHRAWSGSEPNYYTASSADMARINNDPYYTNSLARAHFEQAAKLAKTPALAAKAAYMAARCQHDAFRVRREFEREKMGTYPSDDDPAFLEKMNKIAQSDYSQYSAAFRQQYLNTPFAKDMETNCALYREVVNE